MGELAWPGSGPRHTGWPRELGWLIGSPHMWNEVGGLPEEKWGAKIWGRGMKLSQQKEHLPPQKSLEHFMTY